MLNITQLLIKAAQYLDMNLKELKIKQTSQKERLSKNQLLPETHQKTLDHIYAELESLNINQKIMQMISIFLKHYEYMQKEIYSHFDEKDEKEIHWLLLKYFVIPYFAVNFSIEFSEYRDRIDKGLPGGIFWYLPTLIQKQDKDKIIFPLNTVLNWWIDLIGSSASKFYEMNENSTISPSTLKKWHKGFVVPDITSIKDLLGFDYKYDGCFEYNIDESTENNFQNILDFLKLKSLSFKDLKQEIPNRNSIIDNLYHPSQLDNGDKLRFITYISDRWAKATSKQLEWRLTVAMVSQHIYKDLCNYFDTDIQEIKNNRILELINLHNEIYNARIELQHGRKQSQYLDDIKLVIEIKTNPKSALDKIIAKISSDLSPHKCTINTDEYVYKAINILNTTLNTADEEKYIISIDNCDVLNNIGEYFMGNNYLTDEIVIPNRKRSFMIFKHYFEIANTELHIKVSLAHLLNLATFPCYSRYLKVKEVEALISSLERIIDKKSSRENLSFLQFNAYHHINRSNEKAALSFIRDFMNNTSSLKPEAYIVELLFIAENLEYIRTNKKFFRKLHSRNIKHPQYSQFQNIYKDMKYYKY